MMRRAAWLLPLLVVAGIFAARVHGPPDFLDKDQPRPIEYIIDAVADGHWIVQRDGGGDVTSKPPVFTWLAGISTIALGGSRTALYLPCGLAMAALALMAWGMSRRRLGFAGALAAAMCVALAVDTQKAIALARTDAVFAACVGACAWLALRAWERGRGWWLFWAACGVVSIAKSPAGVLFAAGGLGAAWWGRNDPDRPRHPATWRQHLPGIGLFLLIAGGWFVLAVLTLGQPVVDKMLGRELVGHVVANDKGTPLWRTLPQPLLWFSAFFLPWSVAAGVAVWRLVRHPPASAPRRRLLRFMACWLGVGLLALCLAPHKRMILSLPMLLPAAVLAGSEIGRWTVGIRRSRLMLAWAVLAVAIIGGLLAYHHLHRDRTRDGIDAAQGVLDASETLAAWRSRGAAIAWSGLPPSMRYFTAGHPVAIPPARIEAHLAMPGPGVVAVPTPTAWSGPRRTIAPGIDLLLDAEAEALAP